MTITLYDFWRSSAAYRVRIALNLKGVAFERVPISLADGEHHDPSYRAVNAQALITTLEIDGRRLTQSLAILEYLDETRPDPAFLPSDPAARAAVRAKAQIIAADIHPVQNLRVMHRLRDGFGADQEAQFAWNRHWIEAGFAALEVQAGDAAFLSGDAVGLADICLVPQMANARRFKVDLGAYPKLVAIDARCLDLDAFRRASPEAVRPE